jgi:peroxiredoxin
MIKKTITSSFSILIFCSFFFTAFSLQSFRADSTTDATKVIHDFHLKNVDGKMVSLSDYKEAKGFIIIFTCNHCPFAKLYSKRMNDLYTRFSKLNVPLLAINSMDTLVYEEESFALMIQKAKKDKFKFPYLQDNTQEIGQAFGAEHTPMAFVIWKVNNEWVRQYKGAIDDNGMHAKQAKPFIANAVNDLIADKKVSEPLTQSFGCRIFYRKK